MTSWAFKSLQYVGNILTGSKLNDSGSNEMIPNSVTHGTMSSSFVIGTDNAADFTIVHKDLVEIVEVDSHDNLSHDTMNSSFAVENDNNAADFTIIHKDLVEIVEVDSHDNISKFTGKYPKWTDKSND